MKGLIIYDRQSLQKNAFFADKLQAELHKLGAEAQIVCTHELKGTLHAQEFDFAVMRVYDKEANAELDEREIPTFNSSAVALIANDKLETYNVMRKCGIPTAITETPEECDLPFPRIVKARHGHGGSEVFWAEDEEQYKTILASMTDKAIVQPPTGKRGKDLRVYVINGKPIVGFLRISDEDFRSNYSLGGRAERYPLDSGVRKLVKQVCSVLSPDFAGIDFLLGEDGGYILNEVEDVVGCRMVYIYSRIDIIKKYARHIVWAVKRMKNP